MVSEPPRRKKLPEINTLADVVELIRKSQKIIILTGAGVSVSCGIPDFRSRNGIYARLAVDFPDLPDPQAMFDIHYFRKDPRPFFKFAKEIYPGQFEPSPCHKFIKSVENHGKLLRNYTQNIGKLFNLLKFAIAGLNCSLIAFLFAEYFIPQFFCSLPFSVKLILHFTCRYLGTSSWNQKCCTMSWFLCYCHMYDLQNQSRSRSNS